MDAGSIGAGSDAGSASVGSLFPLILVGGSIAGIAIVAPQIPQWAADMGIVLPPLPGLPVPPPARAVAPPVAPGPPAPNGRGGEPGVVGGNATGAIAGVNAVVVMTGSLGDYEVDLPEGISLPPLPFIK